MFKCGSGHRQVETLIADPLRQTTPAASHGEVDRKNSALVGAQNRIEPTPEALCSSDRLNSDCRISIRNIRSASNGLRPARLFFSASGVSATASMSARKLSQGTSAAIASSGDPDLVFRRKVPPGRAANALGAPKLGSKRNSVAAINSCQCSTGSWLVTMVEEHPCRSSRTSRRSRSWSGVSGANPQSSSHVELNVTNKEFLYREAGAETPLD